MEIDHRLPERLRFRVLEEGVPSSGFLLRATYKCVRKNDYTQIYGPSDAEGVIEVTRQEVLRLAQQDADFFPADYAPLETAFSGRMEVRAMNREDADRALSAYGLYRGAFPYPSGYEDMLRDFQDMLQRDQMGTTSVVVVEEQAVEGDGGKT